MRHESASSTWVRQCQPSPVKPRAAIQPLATQVRFCSSIRPLCFRITVTQRLRKPGTVFPPPHNKVVEPTHSTAHASAWPPGWKGAPASADGAAASVTQRLRSRSWVARHVPRLSTLAVSCAAACRAVLCSAVLPVVSFHSRQVGGLERAACRVCMHELAGEAGCGRSSADARSLLDRARVK